MIVSFKNDFMNYLKSYDLIHRHVITVITSCSENFQNNFFCALKNVIKCCYLSLIHCMCKICQHIVTIFACTFFCLKTIVLCAYIRGVFDDSWNLLVHKTLSLL